MPSRDTPPKIDRPSPPEPFWRTKTLEEMSDAEWEQLCDGCGRCCLLKLEEEETGVLHYTRLACRLLDIGSCRCRDYDNRHAEVTDCLRLDVQAVRTLRWLPPTCGYRLVAEGKDLAWWHPLISGDPQTVHTAGISVRGMARSEIGVREQDMDRYIIEPEPPQSHAKPVKPEPRGRRSPAKPAK